MYKYCLVTITLLLFCFHGDAQFKKLLNKAKEKAIEAVTGQEDSTPSPSVSEPQQEPETGQRGDAEQQDADARDEQDAPEKNRPAQITFPVTGDTVTAMHAVFAPVLDGDIQKIMSTPQGKYGIKMARDKGLQGTDMEVFRQLLEPENASLSEAISEAIKEKFPETDQKQDNGKVSFNPAHNGFSTPSFYFKFMVGEFDVWMTDHFVKWALRHDHATMAEGFGVNVVAITDLQKRVAYSIGSVLGVNYTTVHSLDTLNRPYGPLALMPLLKDTYQGIDGIEIKTGAPEKFGDYNCSVVEVIIPVRPFVDKQTHQPDKSLLSLHDILSGRDDAVAHDGKGNWDPSYRIIYKGYFSHDIEKYLPEKIKEMVRHLKWKKGIGVGAAIADEKGNSADFRLIDVTTSNKVDKGSFSVPEGYPVMTEEQLNEAIKKQFSLKNLLRSGARDKR